VGPYQHQEQEIPAQESSWFNRVLAHGVHVSDVFSGHWNSPHLVIALTNPFKTYVMRATISSTVIKDLLYSALIGTHGDAFILNANGDFQTERLREVAGLNAMEFKMVRHHHGTDIRTAGQFMYGGKWLNDNMWLLVVQTRITDSLGSYYTYRDCILLVVAVTIAAFLLISIGIAQFIVNWMQDADKEQSALDQQMAHIEKMANIGRLAAGIAHEINNPLQMIQMQAGLVEEMLEEEKGLPTEEYRKSLAKIKHHVSRAGAITHRLLGFSGKLSAKYGVQVNDLLRETVSFLENEAKQNDIVLNLQLDESLPTIRTDGTQVQQALLNIIENSIDAVGSGGQVIVITGSTVKEIQIRIEDNGPGIKPEILKKIWELFFTTKEAGRGTGLGLSICSDIIHKLGGTITAENKSEGGARFTVRLPIRS
jgi:two-component system, NtrC family, sensor kinase